MITPKLTHGARRRCVAAASLVCLLASANALASDASTQRSVKVSYSDLNLSTRAGATTLYQRISGAARFVCGDRGRPLDEIRRWNTCYHDAIADAVAAVNSPMLRTVTRGDGIVSAMLAK